MFLDRSTRTVLAVILATAAAILGVNLVINPGGLTGSMGPLFLFLAGLAAIFWAWNWRESYALAHPKDDDDDEAPVIPRVFAPALLPELEAPAVTLSDASEAAAAPSPIMAPVVAPVIAPAPVSSAPHVNLDAAPAVAKAPEAVMPPAPTPSPAAPATPPSAPDIPQPSVPTPAPATPPAPAPVEPPTPVPVEPPLPSPSEPSPPTPSEPPTPVPVEPLPEPAEPVSQQPPIAALGADLPQPLHTASVTDLASPDQKASAPNPTAAATITDAKNGEPVAEKVVGEAMAAPQQPDASVVQQTDPAPQVTVPESNQTPAPVNAPKSKKGTGTSKPPKAPTAPAPAASTPDDLTRIEGIGKYYSDALHKIGIDTFGQLAAEQHDVILTKLLAAGFRRHPTIPTWPEQAALAARGDWDGLKALQATLTGGRRA